MSFFPFLPSRDTSPVVGHSAKEQIRVSYSRSQRIWARQTCFDRVLRPSPQVTEQGPHSDHGPSAGICCGSIGRGAGCCCCGCVCCGCCG